MVAMPPFKVVISQHRLLHYRVAFFERLRERCAERGIDLRLLHGQASHREKLKRDEGAIAWADKVHNTIRTVKGVDLVWQPVPGHLKDSDLAILIHENRMLSNYGFLARRLLRQGPMLAFWGHGANFQSASKDTLRERWKKKTTTMVDYWFGYTQITVDLLKQNGFPSQRITNLNNSIDTETFRLQCDSVTDVRQAKLRATHAIPLVAPIGLFCGSLYPEKRLDLLVAAADVVREEVPDFQVVVIGAGPSLPFMECAARSRSWLHLVGIRTGQEKADWFRTSQVMLNPGLVGLHVLDSLVAGLPIVSTVNALHSPEIAYLENGATGLLTDDGPQAYAAAVSTILKDKSRREVMVQRGREASRRYSLEAMLDNFVEGIESCRALGKRR